MFKVCIFHLPTPVSILSPCLTNLLNSGVVVPRNCGIEKKFPLYLNTMSSILYLPFNKVKLTLAAPVPVYTLSKTKDDGSFANLVIVIITLCISLIFAAATFGVKLVFTCPTPSTK